MEYGLIFDMDGTMVNNMKVHLLGWQKILAENGLHLTFEEVIAICHGKNTEIVERLFPNRFSLEERERIGAEKERRYREIFLPQLKLIDGLPELLETARQAGIPMGIGTAAPKENVDFVLNQLQIRHYFKSVVDADAVDKGKPDPTVFKMVADGLGMQAHRCLVFEDSPTGAQTALNAGMKTVIITTSHKADEFASYESVLRCVDNYLNINLIEMIERL